MFEHILIPVDFTEKNAEALDVAIKLAQEYRARITVLHVIEPIEYEDDEIRAFYKTLEAKAWANMKSLVGRITLDDAWVNEQVLIGHRVSCIVEYVTAHTVDLLVLSSHRIDFDHPSKGGATLSYQLSILCPCPVLLLK